MMSDFNIHEILRKANEEINDDFDNKEAFSIFNELPETQLDAISLWFI